MWMSVGLLISNRGKLFATDEVQLTDNAIDIFLAFVGHMSCSADNYVSLGASNGCADQLTNWDGIQKLGLKKTTKRKTYRLSINLILTRKEIIARILQWD